MRNQIISFLLFWILAGQLYADSREDAAEKLRSGILRKMSNADATKQIPLPVLKEYTAIIGDDSAPISEQTLNDLFDRAEATGEKAIRRELYLTALLFRERDKPEKVLVLYDKLTPDERALVFGGLLTTFKPFINQNYLPLALVGLRSAIKDADSAEKKGVFKRSYALVAYEWVGLVAKTENAKAAEELKNIFAKEVPYIPNANFRFNLCSTAISTMGSDALPIAKWYFPEYAWKPQEIAVFAKYLRKYDDSASFGAMANEKEVALRESLEAMNPNYNPASKKTTERITRELNEGAAKPTELQDIKPTKESSDKK